MTKKQLQKKAIAHYDRMIAWAEKTKRRYACHSEMFQTIGENWSGIFCCYCSESKIPNSIILCEGCPLDTPLGCCNYLWVEMNQAKTWKKWVAAAKKVRQYIIDHGV